VYTGLAVAAFLLASQPAAASAFLFASTPASSQTAPGALGEFEIDLTNTGSSPEQIGAFRFGLATNISGITFESVTTGTLLDPYIFAVPGSWHGPGIATTLNPSEAVMDQTNGSNITLAPGETVGLGYVSYQVNSNATPGSVIEVSFEPTYLQTGGSCPSGLCEYVSETYALTDTTYTYSTYSLVGGSITVGSQDLPADAPEPEPGMVIPVGLLLIGLGALRKRRFHIGRRRRRIAGVRKPPEFGGSAPSHAEPYARYIAL